MDITVQSDLAKAAAALGAAPLSQPQPQAQPALQAQMPQSVRPQAGMDLPTGEGLAIDPQSGQTVPRVMLPGPPKAPASLDTIMQGVWQVESGNRQTDAEGRIIRSPAGALGVSQLMPGTAAQLGVDPFDETQNREGGKRYLAEQFDKYGNWPDALAAYNWGPGNVDKWIAQGRDAGKMPRETQNYIAKVLGGVGEAAPGQTGAQIVEGTQRNADLQRAVATIMGDNDGKKSDIQRMVKRQSNEDFLRELQEKPGASDFAYGMVRGAMNLVLGPTQATLEQIAPQMAQGFTNTVNEIDDTMRRQLGVQGREKGTILGTAGDIVGGTLGILGAAKLISLPAEMAAVNAKIPLFLRTTGTGAAFGSSTYNEKPEDSSRVVGGILGGTVGALAGIVGKGLEAASKFAAQKGVYDRFVQTLKDATGDLTPSTSRMRDRTIANYERLWQEKNARYNLRNAEGRDLAEGFPRADIERGPFEAMQGSRRAGVAPTATTRSVAGQVDRELGGPEVRALKAEHDLQMRDYQATQKAWEKDYGRFLYKPGAGVSDAEAANLNRQIIQRGNLPPAPEPPPPFDPPAITPEQFSAAVQAVNRAWVKAKNDPATQHQLAVMSREMMAGAKKAAADVGMDVAQFMRASKEAGEFFRENIVPLQKYFKFRSPQQAADVITPAKMYGDAVKLIEGRDTEALKAFKKLIGPSGNDDLLQIAAHRAITSLENGKSVGDYIRAHDEQLSQLLSREAMQELRGIANVGDAIINRVTGPQNSRLMRWANHPWFAGLVFLHGVSSGNVLQMAGGAAAYMFPQVLQATSHVVAQMKGAGMAPLLRRASRMKPDSPEMDNLLRVIERRAEVAAAVGGQETADSGPSRLFQRQIARQYAPVQRAY